MIFEIIVFTVIGLSIALAIYLTFGPRKGSAVDTRYRWNAMQSV